MVTISLLIAFRERPVWDYNGKVNLDLVNVYRNGLSVNDHIDRQKVIALLRETTGRRSFNSYGSFSTDKQRWAIMAGDGRYGVFVNIVGDYSYWYFGDGVNFFDIGEPKKFEERLENLYEEGVQSTK
jgi:hypothetical protein